MKTKFKFAIEKCEPNAYIATIKQNFITIKAQGMYSTSILFFIPLYMYIYLLLCQRIKYIYIEHAQYRS